MEWNYKRVEEKFEQLPVGKYRLRIKSAEKKTSQKSGNDMLVLTFEVSGSNQTLMHYIPFLPDNPDVTNRMLTQFFDSFGLKENFVLTNWIGKTGGCQTKMEEYNGEERARIAYFLSKKQQESLPAWQDGQTKKPKLTPIDDGDIGDLPF